MDFLSALWIPILASAALIWFASFLCHTVLPNHKGEWKGLPQEDAALDALEGTPAGNYMIPFCTMEQMKSPEFIAKQKRFNATLVVYSEPVSMGRNLVLSFLTYVVISAFVAALAWQAFLPAGSMEYIDVFKFTAFALFGAHTLALLPQAIWFGGIRVWAALLDGLIYALAGAGVFAWLWPGRV